jgi:hypothetical protein
MKSRRQGAVFGGCEDALRRSSPELFRRYSDIRKGFVERIAPRQQMKDDTESGAAHLKAVHANADRLIPAAKLRHLSAIELYVLLNAIYLHDIGKALAKGTLGERHHSAASADAVVDHSAEIGLEEPEALAINHVIKGHGPGISIGKLPEAAGVNPYGSIRLRYLASVVRLADDLDMCYTRAPRIVRKVISPKPEWEPKWTLRQSVSNVIIDPQAWYLEVEAAPRNGSEHSAIVREIEIVNGRLGDARPFLRATPDIGLYYSVVDLRTDLHWLGNGSTQEQASHAPEARVEPQAAELDLPANTVCAILRYDPASVTMYDEIVVPALTDCDCVPILIENVAPEGTLVERTLKVLRASKCVVVLLEGAGVPSVYFRLGVAMGLGKEVLGFAPSGTPSIGDLSGMRVSIFETEDDLKKQIRARVREALGSQ